MRKSAALCLALALVCIACGKDDCFGLLYGLPCSRTDAERSDVMLVGFPPSQFNLVTVLRTGVHEAPMPLGQRIDVHLEGSGTERVRSVQCLPTDPTVVRFEARTALSGTLEASTAGVTGVPVAVTFRDGSTKRAGLYACGPSLPPAGEGCAYVETIRVTP